MRRDKLQLFDTKHLILQDTPQILAITLEYKSFSSKQIICFPVKNVRSHLWKGIFFVVVFLITVNDLWDPSGLSTNERKKTLQG